LSSNQLGEDDTFSSQVGRWRKPFTAALCKSVGAPVSGLRAFFPLLATKQDAKAADVVVALGETPGQGQAAIPLDWVVHAFGQPLPELGQPHPRRPAPDLGGAPALLSVSLRKGATFSLKCATSQPPLAGL
jgi:hypothetical protein